MMDEPFPFEKVYGGIAGIMLYASMINECNSAEMALVLSGVYLLLIYLLFGAPGCWERKQRKKKDE